MPHLNHTFPWEITELDSDARDFGFKNFSRRSNFKLKGDLMDNIREEVREIISRARTAKTMAFFEEKLHRDRTDVYGFVPYNMVSVPIPAGDKYFHEFIMSGAFSESL